LGVGVSKSGLVFSKKKKKKKKNNKLSIKQQA
jgi:hypothetical protein